MAVVRPGMTIFQAKVSKLMRPLDTIWKNFWSRTSEQELLCCGSIVKIKQMFGSCSLTTNSFLSAILDRQGLLNAAPAKLRTKKAEIFSPQLLQGCWSKLKKKNPEIVVTSPTITTKSFKHREVVWQQHHLCLSVAQHQIGGTLSYFGTWVKKDLVVDKICKTFRKSTTANEPSCVARNPSFRNLCWPSPSLEQQGRSGRQQRSRSRERVPSHAPSEVSQQPPTCCTSLWKCG